MSLLRRYILCALSLLLLAGCGGPELDYGRQGDNPQSRSLYDVLLGQFDAGARLVGFTDSGGGRYKASFSTATCEVDGSAVPVVMCGTAEWPSLVPGRDGEWRIEGRSTGVAVTEPDDPEQIVMLIYDTDALALFVRLSSGRILFFHKHKVEDIGCFRFEASLNPSLTEDIVCTVSNGVVKGRPPRNLSSMTLIATFACRGGWATCGNRTFLSSITPIDYSSNQTLRFGAPLKSYTVTLPTSANIPVLSISTSGRTIQRDTYIPAQMTVDDPDLLFGSSESAEFTMEIKGRGNSTWGMPKRPYKLKLSEKSRLLGMSNDKHWVLLANYSDKSLLRNELAFEISRAVGMHWTPRSRPVEVYLNGSYQGEYALTEHVRVSPERVNIEVVGPSDNEGNTLTGGYFLWIDNRALFEKGQPGFETPRLLPVTFEDPEQLTPQQRAYIEKYVRDAEQALETGTFEEISRYIDVESFVQYFIVQEVAKNVDGDMRLSTYMWKPYLGRLGFPCVWDFDIAFGNVDYHLNGNGIDRWHIRDAIWFRRLFRHPEFVARATEGWRRFYAKRGEVRQSIVDQAAQIDAAQRRNFEKWRILGIYVWPNFNAESRTTYKQELDYLLWFYDERVAWMNREIEAGRLRIN